MESVEFIGITFRHAGHLGWFQISMFILLLTMFVISVGIYKKKYSEIYTILKAWLMFMGFFHSIISILAIFLTNFGAITCGDLSSDCIWFNALMAGIYVALNLIIRYLKRR